MLDFIYNGEVTLYDVDDPTLSTQEVNSQWPDEPSRLGTTSAVVDIDDALPVLPRFGAPRHQLSEPSCPLEQAISPAHFTGCSLRILG